MNESISTIFTVNAAIPTINTNISNGTYIVNGSSITFTTNNATNAWYNWTPGGTQTDAASASSFPVELNFTGSSVTVDAHANNSAGYIANSTYTYLLDNTQPSVAISGLSDGDLINGTQTITATVSDSESGISNVKFYVGNATRTLTLKSTDTVSPYTYDWNTYEFGDGNKTINITVTDNAGNMNSSVVNVTVNNTKFLTTAVSNGAATFTGTSVDPYLDQVTGLNSSQVIAQVQKTEIVDSPTVDSLIVDTAYLSMNISADTVDSAIVRFKLPKTTSGLSAVLNELFAFATHSDNTTERLEVTYDDVNDDVDNYAFYFTTTKFSVFTIATQTAAPSTSSSGGGGGGGIVPTTTEDTSISKTVVLASVASGETGSFNYDDVEELGIDKVQIQAINNINSAELKVEELDSTTKDPAISSNLGMVYKYVTITPTNFLESDVENVKITFSIQKSWFTDNALDPTTTKLKHFTNNDWTNLAISTPGSVGQNYQFTATTSWFSEFAITAQKIAESAITGESVKEVESEEQVQVDESEETAEPEVKKEIVEKRGNGLTIFLIFVLVLIVGVIIYLVTLIPKGKGEHPLDRYIGHVKEQGHPREQVKQALINEGWDDLIVEHHLNRHYKEIK